MTFDPGQCECLGKDARTKIRQLAADPAIILTIIVIDSFFRELYAKTLPVCPELAGTTAEERIEDYWLAMKQGTLRLCDPDIENNVIVAQAVTPGQRARARHVGAKLFAVRQHIRRAGHPVVRWASSRPDRP